MADALEIGLLRGHAYNNTQISGYATVHMGDVFQKCNHDLLEGHSLEDRVSMLRRSLYYHSMDDRRDQIEEASEESLEWVWSTNLVDWLQSDERIFWISGKPASGKSTLMKYLASHTKTLENLPKVDERWTILQFYFDFRAGKGIANSPVGMLRSMLSQLTEKKPDIADKLLFKDIHQLEGNVKSLTGELENRIARMLKALGGHVCAFIDGLDEFEGSLVQIYRSLLNLSNRTGLKICLASRPETELVRLLSKHPSLEMQKWNQATIRGYFNLVAHDLLKTPEVHHVQTNLLNRIIDDAEGVILWARFAIDEICIHGLLRGLTVSELETCFQNIPPDLGTIYDRILDKVAPSQKLAAGLLLGLLQGQSGSTPDSTISYFASDPAMLLATWITCLEKAGNDCEMIKDLSIDQFRLRIHALLGGLVDFVPSSKTTFRVRLSHKTVSTHLMQKRWVEAVIPDVWQIGSLNQLWPIALAEVMLSVARSARPSWWAPHLITSIWRDHGRGSVGSNSAVTEQLKVILIDTRWYKLVRFLIIVIRNCPDWLKLLDNDPDNTAFQQLIAMVMDSWPMTFHYFTKLGTDSCFCKSAFNVNVEYQYPKPGLNSAIWRQNLSIAAAHGTVNYFKTVFRIIFATYELPKAREHDLFKDLPIFDKDLVSPRDLAMLIKCLEDRQAWNPGCKEILGVINASNTFLEWHDRIEECTRLRHDAVREETERNHRLLVQQFEEEAKIVVNERYGSVDVGWRRFLDTERKIQIGDELMLFDDLENAQKTVVRWLSSSRNQA